MTYVSCYYHAFQGAQQVSIVRKCHKLTVPLTQCDFCSSLTQFQQKTHHRAKAGHLPFFVVFCFFFIYNTVSWICSIVVCMQTYRTQLCRTNEQWWLMFRRTITVSLVHKRCVSQFFFNTINTIYAFCLQDTIWEKLEIIDFVCNR